MKVENTDDIQKRDVWSCVALLVEAIKDLESQLEEKTSSLEEKTKEIDDIKASLEEIQRVLGINKDEASK